MTSAIKKKSRSNIPTYFMGSRTALATEEVLTAVGGT